MKLHILNTTISVLFAVLFTLFHLQFGDASILNMKVNNSTKQNDTSVDGQDMQRSNETATTMAAQTESLEVSENRANTVVGHIMRKKPYRETEVTMPYDFNVLHLPCDFDIPGRGYSVSSFPNHCVWVWNNKYVHEGFYRVFKTYQLEGFFFGQYYERLKRFEMDPHSWDYQVVGVS